MHTDIHDPYSPVPDDGSSPQEDVGYCCDEDDTCEMVAESNEIDMEDTCCC